MASALGFISRNYQTFFPPTAAKEPNAIKIGCLGAAAIAPNALILPAKSHPDVIVQAVAARDKKRAEEFAKKHGIPQVYGSYQELIDDPNIDVIYNPLPPSHHYEWTIKSLNAGKHVFLEKPAGNTVEEVESMFALAKSKNLILLEAFHHRFHPALQKIKELVDSGVVGKIKSVEARLNLPQALVNGGHDAIMYNYELGGGASMHAGCYPISVIQYILGAENVKLVSATPTPVKLTSKESVDASTASATAAKFSKIDEAMRATFSGTGPHADVIATAISDFDYKGKILGVIPIFDSVVEVVGEEGSVKLTNFIAPSMWHEIVVQTKAKGGKETIKAYTFEEAKLSGKGQVWWATYRYQLEAFIDELRGRTPKVWISPEESLAIAKATDEVYEKSGLGRRPVSSYLTH